MSKISSTLFLKLNFTPKPNPSLETKLSTY
jgi:hypothetical protein